MQLNSLKEVGYFLYAGEFCYEAWLFCLQYLIQKFEKVGFCSLVFFA